MESEAGELESWGAICVVAPQLREIAAELEEHGVASRKDLPDLQGLVEVPGLVAAPDLLQQPLHLLHPLRHGPRQITHLRPIRLDVAVPINKRDTDDEFQFYISFGQAF